jgi:thymidylate kinase
MAKRRKIILIVGPSGVGKTSAFRLIQSWFPACTYRHLDGLASDWAVELGWLDEASVSKLRGKINDDQLFLAFGLEAVGTLAGREPERHLVIDVGAGFQDARSAEYLPRVHDVIAITADPYIAYQRIRKRRGERRSFEQYAAQEFSARRIKVYAGAHRTIDSSTLALEETADRLAKVVLELTS